MLGYKYYLFGLVRSGLNSLFILCWWLSEKYAYLIKVFQEGTALEFTKKPEKIFFLYLWLELSDGGV